MARTKGTRATAGEMARQFSHYSDIALQGPVFVTKNGRPRNVLISVNEYERLKKRDQQAFMAAGTPDEFLSDMRTYLRGKKR